jgi:SAM-dependent methyltransferase
MTNAQDLLFRDYKPYGDEKVRWRRLNSDALNAAELANMDRLCQGILDSMTLKEYINAKRGIALVASEIQSVLDEFSIPVRGNVLEFGAGTCKLSAVLSKNESVESISCLDFSETLLREIAPRAISYIGGNLDKIEFLIGDMNRIEDVPGEFDWVVCYGAVHHLVKPERFFANLRQRLKPNGRVLCLDEPALPEIVLPYKELKSYLKSVSEKRAQGENENVYRMSKYRRMASPWFKLEDLTRNKYERRMRYWTKIVFKVNFILTPI